MAKAGRTTNKGLPSRILGLLNPIRDPSLVVAIILTVIEQAGNSNTWWQWLLFGLLNWIAVKALIWLLVNFFFSFVYLARKSWWVFRNPRLAWRLLDALGTEEIIIGGLRPDMFATEDGMLHEGQLGMAGMGAGYFNGPALGAGYPQNGPEGGLYPDLDEDSYGQYGRGSQFSERLSQQSEDLQALLATYNKLIGDWMAYTEEKWRAVSDSQLGWKQLRGRWNGWDEIYRDAWASSNEASQIAAETMARRFESARSKGSAASSVACFLRDVDSLRQSLVELEGGAQPNSQQRMGGMNSQSISQRTGKAPIIRNPMIVDADG